VDRLADGEVSGDRASLARAITLIESRRDLDASPADELLERLLPRTGSAHRVGISGVPGVGKSTLIDALGMHLVEAGHRVAVLAVDPSSTISGGSILGDKSRMPRLAADERAFIRPSPSAATLGGVARRTRESMLLCEAAGHDVVLVETVGVGQSETLVADMVDFFLLLTLPGAGDELQGIKKGIVEVADVIAVNKADGDLLPRAREAVADSSAALRYLRPRSAAWRPRAVMVSARTGDGIPGLWSLVEEHRATLSAAGEHDRLREEQRLRWMWSLIDEGLAAEFRADPAVRARLDRHVADVRAGRLSPGRAAADLLRSRGDGS
jgi:LAO/AO transport system kinase